MSTCFGESDPFFIELLRVLRRAWDCGTTGEVVHDLLESILNPRLPQDGANMAPAWLQDGPNMAPRGSRWPQDGPKSPQDGFKLEKPQDTPKIAQDGFKIFPRVMG